MRTFEDRVESFAEMAREASAEWILENDKFMNYLENDGFFTAPASTKYHGAYEGGLYDHSEAVARTLIDLTEKNNLIWINPESPFVIGMFHDLCKCDQYVQEPGQWTKDDILLMGDGLYHYEYNKNTILKGHGSKSVMILSQFITLTEEELLCIRYHMGAYEKEEYSWEDLDRAIKKYPMVYWTHVADMITSKIIGV